MSGHINDKALSNRASENSRTSGGASRVSPYQKSVHPSSRHRRKVLSSALTASISPPPSIESSPSTRAATKPDRERKKAAKRVRSETYLRTRATASSEERRMAEILRLECSPA